MMRLLNTLQRCFRNRAVRWAILAILVALLVWTLVDVLFYGGSLGTPTHNPGKARGY